MTAKAKGLGRGLDALLGAEPVANKAAQAEATLPLTALQPGKYQPRTQMDDTALLALAESIRSQGVIQPVLVRPAQNNKYEIIAGERRVRAAEIAGLENVPVVIRNIEDRSAAVMALIENIQREDLNPLEEARGIKKLMEDFSMSQEEAARSVGASRSAVANLLRLLNLTGKVQSMLLEGQLDMGHARALLALSNADQVLAANEVVAQKLSVRDTEQLVTRKLLLTQGANGGQTHTSSDNTTTVHHDAASQGKETQQKQASRPSDSSGAIEQYRMNLQTALSDRYAAEVGVRIKTDRSRSISGEISFRFGSQEELESLANKLESPSGK